MISYPDLIQKFYDEFPYTVGMVTFRHAKYQYPDIQDTSSQKVKNKLAKYGNCVTQDFNTSIQMGQPAPCIVMANGYSTFISAEPSFMSETQTGLCKNMEQEFIFYHETYHALQRMKYRHPHNFKLLFSEECAADAYASLRLAANHGNASIPLLKYIANLRMVNTGDMEHLTTFTMDTTLSIIENRQSYLNTCSPMDFIGLAEQIGLIDPLYDLIDNQSFHRIHDIETYIKSIPTAFGQNTNHADWIKERYINASYEIHSQILRDRHKNMGGHTPTQD